MPEPRAYRDLQDEIARLRQELAETKAELVEVGQVATEAVNVLLAVGAWGLHGSKQNDLWAEARGLHARLTGRTGEKPAPSADELTLIRLVAIKARAWVWADRNGRPQGPGARGDKRKLARTELKAAVDAWKAAGG